MPQTRRGTGPPDRAGETWNFIYRFGQHWPLALFLGLLAAGLGFVYSRGYEPIYHAEGQVRIGEGLDARVQGQQNDPGDMVELPETLANSFRARFLVQPKMEAMARELVQEPQLQHIGLLKSEKGREDLIDHIRLHIQVEPVTRRVYRVIYDGHDPDLVQRVVQRLCEIGVADVIEQRVSTARQARSFLKTESEAARQQMIAAEQGVVRFLRDHPGLMVSAGAVDRSKLGLQMADKLLVGRERVSGLTPLQALDASTSPQVRQLLSQRADLEASITQIEAAQKFDPVQNKISEIDRLQQQLSELKAQNYTKEYPEYQRISGDIERLKQEIHDHKSQRDRNLSADLRTLADARTQMSALDRQIALLRHRAVGGDKKAAPDESLLSAETEYNRLTKDMETARTSYDKLHERELEAQINEELSKAKGNLAARIEEPAKRPDSPRGVSRKMMTALCVLLGFGLGVLAGALRALTDPHIYTVFDLARASNLPVLGRVPASDGGGASELAEVSEDDRAPMPLQKEFSGRTPEPIGREPSGEGVVQGDSLFMAPTGVSDYMVVYSSPRDPTPSGGIVLNPVRSEVERSRSALMASPQSAAFRMSAMGHILHQGQLPSLPHLFLHSEPDGARAEQYRLLRCRLQDQSDPKVLVVTSALPGEGKTTAAANLALSYAEGGAHSVVLIDAHLSSPRLTAILGAQPRAEALLDPEMMSNGLDIWQYAPNLFLVPALGPRVKRSAVLSSPAFAMLVADLRQTFDYVIIDSPAVASAADAKILLRCVDAGLFLTRARTTTSQAVRVALDRLGRRVMAGVVLNEFGR